MISLRQSTKNTNREKGPQMSENPLATPSDGNSFFPEKTTMDLRNEINFGVWLRYKWSLVVGTLKIFLSHM